MSGSFYQKLTQMMAQNNSFLCLGLDPNPHRYPKAFPDGPSEASLVAWGQAMIDSTADVVCCYKPNVAFYEQFGLAGWQALKQTLAHIPADIPILLDAKRGDIGSTAAAYARSVFEVLGADAVTLSPYLGQDSVAPFLSYPGKAVFILCYTSNPSAGVLQEFPSPSRPLYLQVAQEAQTWGNSSEIGLVVGATQAQALQRVRAVAPQNLILAPGLGAQGGDLVETVTAGLTAQRDGLIVPVSRGILYADNPRQAALTLRDALNDARQGVSGGVDSKHPQEALILNLYDTGCVKFGEFTLASGEKSPYYIDLRQIISNPTLFAQVIAAYAELLAPLTFDRLAGIPYGALPTAAGLALHLGRPMVYPRKEVKAHGLGRAIEGQFSAGERVVIIEDLITSGNSAIQGGDTLRSAGLQVEDVVVLIDREQGGRERLIEAGYQPHAALTLTEIVRVLRSAGRLSEAELAVLTVLPSA